MDTSLHRFMNMTLNIYISLYLFIYGSQCRFHKHEHSGCGRHATEELAWRNDAARHCAVCRISKVPERAAWPAGEGDARGGAWAGVLVLMLMLMLVLVFLCV